MLRCGDDVAHINSEAALPAVMASFAQALPGVSAQHPPYSLHAARPPSDHVQLGIQKEVRGPLKQTRACHSGGCGNFMKARCTSAFWFFRLGDRAIPFGISNAPMRRHHAPWVVRTLAASSHTHQALRRLG